MSSNKTKNISNGVYSRALEEFSNAEGILSPIYADTIIKDPFYVKSGDVTAGTISNVLDIIDGSAKITNRVVGYFAAKKDDHSFSENKYIMAMSFCAPEDYEEFSSRYARFLAMRKCLSNSCMMIHVNKAQRVITKGYWPIYYFDKDNTIDIQLMEFETRCIKYYR